VPVGRGGLGARTERREELLPDDKEGGKRRGKNYRFLGKTRGEFRGKMEPEGDRGSAVGGAKRDRKKSSACSQGIRLGEGKNRHRISHHTEQDERQKRSPSTIRR